jgi:RNA polymerase sigma factor (sigma-70 family)
MASTTLSPVLRHIQRLIDRPGADGLTDRQLLQQFAAHHDEAAFAALVRRHGPLVFGVARRLLPCSQDAEDAFQATFLVLARKAGSICWRESVGGWLYEVAQRIARKAQAATLRRRGYERQAATMRQTQTLPEVPDRDIRTVLDEEIRRLPEVYRAPIVLCYLEGKSHTEAAAQLGWPEGTIKGRLARARDRLRGRLIRRGLTLSASALAVALARQEIVAAVPAALTAATTRAATMFAAVPVVAGGVSAQAAAWAEGLLQGLAVAKVKTLSLLLLALGLVLSGSAVLACRVPADQTEAKPASLPAATGETPVPEPAKPKPHTDRYGDPLPPGALARPGTTRFRHGYILYRALFSPDGRMVASAGGDRGVCLWDVATGKEANLVSPGRHCYGLAFSPDGKLLAGSDLNIHIWDTATGKEVRQLPRHEGGATMVLAFSPDGRMIASGGHDRLVRLREVATGKELRQLEGHQAVINALAFTPDGRTLASAGVDKTIRLWDVATGQARGVLVGHKDHIPSIDFSPDGRLLASASHDQTIRLWDVASGKEIRVFDGLHRTVESVALAPDGKTPDRGAKQGIRKEVQSVAFAPDGKMLASAHGDNYIRLWDLATGKEVRAWQAHAYRVSTVAFSPDGQTLVSGATWDSGPRFWDVATGQEQHQFSGHRGPVVQLAFSADGETLYSTSRDKTVRRWDLVRGGDERLWFAWHSVGFDASALSPDHKTLATADRFDKKVRLWDSTPGKESRLLGKHDEWVHALAFSPDGKLLASGGKDLVIRLWDVTAGKELAQLKGHEDEVCSLAFSPDGKTLASGATAESTGGRAQGRTLRLWDVAARKELRPFEGRGEVYSVMFSPDGKRIAAGGGWLGRARIWDVATGKELRPLNVPAGCYEVAFCPNGKFLAWAGTERDNTVRVLEIASGQEVRRYHPGKAGCLSLAFSPDGRRLASGGGDSAIVVWDLTGRMTNDQLAGRVLSPQELEACWATLADMDASKAYDAIWSLVAAARQAVPFLAGQVRPVTAADPRLVAGLIADLDNNRFAVRKKTMQELEKLGDAAEPALRKALDGKPPLEVRQRIEQLLEKMDLATSPDQLRVLRAVGALEYAGTTEARQVLRTLAGGTPEARLTREAAAALERLAKAGNVLPGLN